MTEPGGIRDLGNAFTIAQDATRQDARGAVWRLTDEERDLDSNIVRIPPGHSIGPHDGPDLDVMILVLTGAGTYFADGPTSVSLSPGQVLWLARHTRRHFTAGAAGVTYLAVHRRRPKLSITTATAQSQ